MSGVTALSGIMPRLPQTWHNKQHNKATNAPMTMVAGSKRRWLSVVKRRRAKWGTAKPMKAIGPQKAVVTAVRSPVSSNKA